MVMALNKPNFHASTVLRRFTFVLKARAHGHP